MYVCMYIFIKQGMRGSKEYAFRKGEVCRDNAYDTDKKWNQASYYDYTYNKKPYFVTSIHS